MEIAEAMSTETSTSFEVSLNAKGFGQWVVKTKYPTTEMAKTELEKAIDAVKSVLKEKGIVEAGQQ